MWERIPFDRIMTAEQRKSVRARMDYLCTGRELESPSVVDYEDPKGFVDKVCDVNDKARGGDDKPEVVAMPEACEGKKKRKKCMAVNDDGKKRVHASSGFEDVIRIVRLMDGEEVVRVMERDMRTILDSDVETLKSFLRNGGYEPSADCICLFILGVVMCLLENGMMNFDDCDMM